MRVISRRLLPGTLLREEILRITKDEDIKAGVLLSVVGHLSKANLRMPDGKTVRTWEEPMEIVSGTGTLSKGDMHIHMSLGQMDGNVIGGHLKEGSIIDITVELNILVLEDREFARENDTDTGYAELVIKYIQDK